jgi:hypothetical protein
VQQQQLVSDAGGGRGSSRPTGGQNMDVLCTPWLVNCHTLLEPAAAPHPHTDPQLPAPHFHQ